MPSPFPGMDPYLEDPAWWQDFHGQYIYALREQLLDRLPRGFDATVEERVRLVDSTPNDWEPDTAKVIFPDVAVLERGEPSRSGEPSGGTATLERATVEPVRITVPAIETREVHERWIELTRSPDKKLITVIELLSPSDKVGTGLVEYRAKRIALVHQRINLVEIDLLLRGSRLERDHRVPPADYYAYVFRGAQPRLCDVYAWNLRRVLPTIPVPLRAEIADVKLDLATAFNDAYHSGRYSRRLSYGQPVPVPLTAEDTAWVEQLTRQAAEGAK